MQLIVELTPEQESALKFIAAKGNQPATEKTPEVIINPEDYLRARFAEVLASYIEQTQREESQAIAEAFQAAPEADRLAVLTALKINRTKDVKTVEENYGKS